MKPRSTRINLKKIIGSICLVSLITSLLFFTLPMSIVKPTGVGAYTNVGSATGLGTDITTNNNWFMYNEYSGGTGTYDIQLGNPKGGINIIGQYTVTDNGNGTYSVNYHVNDGIKVDDQCLSISNSPNFTGKPGQDDNQNFGIPFSADGGFYVFVHLSVEY